MSQPPSMHRLLRQSLEQFKRRFHMRRAVFGARRELFARRGQPSHDEALIAAASRDERDAVQVERSLVMRRQLSFGFGIPHQGTCPDRRRKDKIRLGLSFKRIRNLPESCGHGPEKQGSIVVRHRYYSRVRLEIL